MKRIVSIILTASLFTRCSEKRIQHKGDFIIFKGQMPNLAKDKDNTLHLVYGSGDSIMYAFSSDNGNSFSGPSLISVLPGVYTFAMRGPQIAVANNRIIVTASTSSGNIYSFQKKGGEWIPGARVNDADTIAKEGLMALTADDAAGYAVWLDIRGNRRNKIYGAVTVDGGRTWSKNSLVYTSPDTSVCECCKPSVIIRGDNVYVMFRNRVKGSRDLYLVRSTDRGNTFGQAQKLGIGSWHLNGCPMDGGAMAFDNGNPETVWARKGKIFAAAPGMPETEIGEGRGCTIEILNGKKVYAWTEKDEIVVLQPQGRKKIIGKGSQPVLKALNNEQVICVWENEKQIHAFVIEL